MYSARAVPMPWILVDRDGRRFTNEYEPYWQDTGLRSMERFRPETQDYPRLPCWLIADEPVTPRTVLAATVIVGGVVIITTSRATLGGRIRDARANVRSGAGTKIR